MSTITEITKNVKLIKLSRESSNIYYLSNERVLIDTGCPTDKKELKKIIKDLKIKAVIITHSHWDHIGNIDIFGKIPVYMSKESIDIYEKDKDQLMRFYVREMNKPEFKTYKFKVLQDELFGLKIIKTPGHLRDSIAIYDPKNQYLFSGDTIFANGIVGRTDLTGGDLLSLKKSLKTLSKLQLKTLFPGHGQISHDFNTIKLPLENIKI